MQKEEFITRLLNFGGDWKITDIRVNTDFKEIDIFEYKTVINALVPRVINDVTIR